MKSIHPKNPNSDKLQKVSELGFRGFEDDKIFILTYLEK